MQVALSHASNDLASLRNSQFAIVEDGGRPILLGRTAADSSYEVHELVEKTQGGYDSLDYGYRFHPRPIILPA
jgi:hypothetical protein